MYDQFGQTSVDKWADIPTAGGSTADERITASIAYAEGKVEGCFNGSRYAVPFTVSGSDLEVLKSWMCAHAVEWLRRARGVDTDKKDHIQQLTIQVDKDIQHTVAGIRNFRTGEYDDQTPTGPTAV